MFYHKEEISDLLKCPVCTLTFNNPCVLPCGQHICKSCIDRLYNASKDGIDCTFCHEFHVKPAKGYPISQLIVQLLEKQPREVYRNKMVDSLKSNINEIKLTIANLVQLVDHSERAIRDYCDFVRNNVEQAAATAHTSVDKFREQFLSEIGSYEKECLANLALMANTNQFSTDAIKREMEAFVDEQTRYLLHFTVDDDKVANDLDKAIELRNKLGLQMLQVKSIMFAGKQLVFIANSHPLESKTVGLLRYSFLRVPKSYDFKDMRHLDLHHPVTDITKLHCVHGLDAQHKFVVFYASSSGYHRACAMDWNGSSPNAVYLLTEQHQNIQTIHVFLSAKQGGKVHCYFSGYDYYYQVFKCLRTFDSSLQEVTSNNYIVFDITSLACNEESVFGAEKSSIHVFDNTLKFIKTIAFNSTINIIDASSDRLFVLNTTRQMTLIKLSDDTVERRFAFAYETFIYHVNEFLLSIDNEYKKLIWYDMNGLKYETLLENFPKGLSIADCAEKTLIYLDRSSLVLSYLP